MLGVSNTLNTNNISFYSNNVKDIAMNSQKLTNNIYYSFAQPI
jgi:hypothetical protein